MVLVGVWVKIILSLFFKQSNDLKMQKIYEFYISSQSDLGKLFSHTHEAN